MSRPGLRAALATALLAALWGACLWGLLRGAAAVKDHYAGASLRYIKPIDHAAAQSARRHAAENAGEDSWWPTFWAEGEARVEGTERSLAGAKELRYDGELSLVWPARFIAGGAPGPLDAEGCAVSSALAWALWGSADCVGQQLKVGGRPYTVRGVFEDGENRVLTSYGGRENPEGWTAVELAGPMPGNVEDAARQYAAAAGLPAPHSVLDAALLRFAAGLLAWLPPALAALCALVYLLRRLMQTLRGGRWLVWLGLLLVLAALLPWLLGLLPGWAVPGRWSELSHWAGVMDTLKGMLRRWFMLPPGEKDAAVKGLLLGQGLLCAAGLAGVPLLWRRLGPGRPPAR